MREPIFTGQFRRDSRKAASQGKDMEKMREIVSLLLAGDTLPKRYKDHALKGRWRSYRDLHIEPDWILIYKASGNTVILARTGSHAELFDL